MSDIQGTIKAWRDYLNTVKDWEILVAGAEPIEDGCGYIYELKNPLNRQNESFAIADMRELSESDPHKHINGETEIYFVLQGTGKVAVGRDIHELTPRAAVIIPSDTTHGVIADNDLVLAVVNTPPFNKNNYVALNDTDMAVFMKIFELHTDL
jgi:mannose-6-phosphate isomerase-like protein (cupin superfamily)